MNKKMNNIQIMNEIMTLYIQYVNTNILEEKKVVRKEKNISTLTYDQLSENIAEICGADYHQELKIEKL
jgi:hypothetical protein